MELYLIRHAQSTNNALKDQKDRVSDPLLTELGEEQAQIIAEHFADGLHPELVMGSTEEATGAELQRGFKLTRLFCSAMTRAMQTAQPIGKAIGVDPEVWVPVHEHGGIFLDHQDERGVVGYPGKTRAEILEQFPNYTLPDDVTDEGWWFGTFEEWHEVHGRAIYVANQIVKRWGETDERIGIVTHGGFLDALIKAFHGQLPGNHHYYFHYNTAITRLDIEPSGRFGVRYLNRISHLPPELVS